MDPFEGYRDSRDQLFKSINVKNERERRAPLDAALLRNSQQRFDLGQLSMDQKQKQAANQTATELAGQTAVAQGMSRQQTRKTMADTALNQGNFGAYREITNEMEARVPGSVEMLGATSKLLQLNGGDRAATAATISAQYDMPLEEATDMANQAQVGVKGQVMYDDFIVFTKPDGTVQIMSKPRRQGAGSGGGSGATPTTLKKLIDERQDLIDAGVPLTDPRVMAYDSKISGVNGAPESVNPDGSIDVNGFHYPVDMLRNFAERFNKTGKMPALGMKAGPLRNAIMYYSGVTTMEEGKTGYDVAGGWAETKAQTTSLNKLKPNIDFARAFIDNIDKQVIRVTELLDDITQENPRLLNIPIRMWEEKAVGSAARSKVKLYITEIARETARISGGNPQSIAEISTSAAETWDNIMDLDLPITALKDLLVETRRAGGLRLDSWDKQYAKTLKELQSTPTQKAKTSAPESELPTADEAPEGAIGYDTETKEWVFK